MRFLAALNFIAQDSKMNSQKGLSLLELLIGLAIGLMTVAVAMVALMSSRSTTATINDSSMLQQQFSYVLRLMGQQIRQASSVELDLYPKMENAPSNLSDSIYQPVAFKQPLNSSEKSGIFSKINQDGAYELVVSYSNYTEKLSTNSSAPTSPYKNCLGENGNTTTITSKFKFENNRLYCAGEATYQPIAENVADFKVKYLYQTSDSEKQPQLKYVKAENFSAEWNKIYGVEICIVLFGEENIEIPPTANYQGCESSINFSSLTSPRNRRIHKTYKNTFQLRSQGLI